MSKKKLRDYKLPRCFNLNQRTLLLKFKILLGGYSADGTKMDRNRLTDKMYKMRKKNLLKKLLQDCFICIFLQ